MGGGQSADGEREVTVEERASEDGQPQIIVTQDFLQYVSDRQQEEEGGGGRETGKDRREAPPPYQEEEDIPHLTTQEMISSALPGSGSRSSRREAGEEEANFWRRKYKLEKDKNSELKHVTANEFTKTVAEVREKFAEAEMSSMLPVCEDKKNDVLQCYHANPDKPLLCSREVKEFASCVELARKVLPSVWAMDGADLPRESRVHQQKYTHGNISSLVRTLDLYLKW